MKKLVTIKCNNFVVLEPLRALYYRSANPIFTVEGGVAFLKGGVGFDFFTYFNSLPIGKFKKYTIAEKFYLVMDVQGTFTLDVIGHLPKNRRHQKEWGARFSFDIEKRRKIVIPIPKTMRSDVVSFGIVTKRDTFVYDAYYAADVDESNMNRPRLLMVTDIVSDNITTCNNIESMGEELFNDEEYGRSFKWTIVDKENKLKLQNIPKNIHVVRSDEVLKGTQGESHVVVIGENAVLNADSLKRLYDFLSIIREEYRDQEICAAILKDDEANILVEAVFNKAAKPCSLRQPVYINTDLGLWNSVVDNASISPEEEERYIPYLFYCMPSKKFSVDKMFCSVNDSSETGYALLHNKRDAINISGICAWIQDIKSVIDSSRVVDDSFVALQRIITSGAIEIQVTRNMYYRSEGKIVLDEEGAFVFDGGGTYYDFFTYFNSLSLRKWKRYADVGDIYLLIESEGHFKISLFGHYHGRIGFQKELVGDYEYHSQNKEQIIIPYPRGMQSDLVGFGITAYDKLKIHKFEYVTGKDISKMKSPFICMVTTTFKKESFIERNIELMMNNLFADPEYKENFCWYIIDNGRTLKSREDIEERIQIIPNKNVGGAGGFARGMVESLMRKKQPTHILLMDDDVVFIPDSFKRLYNLLRVIKDEYKDHFISGAMLKAGQPNIQHENTAWINDSGYNEPIKANFDLNLWDAIIKNEEINENIPNRYAAWWFCCVPVGIARLDNLPLPVFFRGDDIEYSLRNRAKLITMNGLCIWHEEFEGRFSAPLDFYLTIRNKLMLRAVNPGLYSIDVMSHVVENFWEELHKFNYKGASFFLDAIEDYMKGPEFYKNTDGEDNMKAKKANDNKLIPVTPKIRSMFDPATLYFSEPLGAKDEKLYNMTHNGQTECQSAKKHQGKETGVIPYGWGSFPGRVYMKNEIIAVDLTNDVYVSYKKSEEIFRSLVMRFETIMDDYEKRHEEVEKAYRDARRELTEKVFWCDYLDMKGGKRGANKDRGGKAGR